MFKFNSKWLVAAALTTTLLSACGGGDGGALGNAGGGGQASQVPNPSTSAQGVVDFLLALIANQTSDLTSLLIQTISFLQLKSLQTPAQFSAKGVDRKIF